VLIGSRSPQSAQGMVDFAEGTDVPPAGPPLSSATLGGVLEGDKSGDGRSKSGLRLHIAFID